MIETLHRLDATVLRELAVSLQQGSLASGLTSHAVQQAVGPGTAADLLHCLQALEQSGWRQSQMAALADALATAKESAANPEQLLELVLSGPDVRGIPTRDTAVVMQALIEKAEHEVIIVAYAIHNGRRLFKRLAERMAETPGLDVWFCLNIPRVRNDTSLAPEIIQRFTREFREKHWPWETLPRLYYDPRSLESNASAVVSLHAKCLITDSRVALVTSANYTEAAQKRNIEAGIIVRHAPCVERLAAYFRSLVQTDILSSCDLK